MKVETSLCLERNYRVCLGHNLVLNNKQSEYQLKDYLVISQKKGNLKLHRRH